MKVLYEIVIVPALAGVSIAVSILTCFATLYAARWICVTATLDLDMWNYNRKERLKKKHANEREGDDDERTE